MHKVKSSNIDSIGYNPEGFELLVKFKNGKTFSYKYLSSIEYEALANAESIGSHFSRFIKDSKVAQELATNKDLVKNDIIASLKDRLESALAHILMIERIASTAPIDKAILALTKAALEIDKAKSNI